MRDIRLRPNFIYRGNTGTHQLIRRHENNENNNNNKKTIQITIHCKVACCSRELKERLHAYRFDFRKLGFSRKADYRHKENNRHNI